MNHPAAFRHPVYRWILALGLLAVPTVLLAQEQGACVTANVPGVFALPDGGARAAGRLTLCLDRTFTPAVGLHRVVADGTTAGLIRSRRSRAEMPARHDPVVLFQRRNDGVLELVGYAVPVGRTTWSYAFVRPQPAAHPGSATPEVPEGDLVAVLARP
jgi:hypothetical protein